MIKNPVLTGFHADPAMICVGDTFYIANSTFEWFPGVKISKSKDLANWQTVCYPLNRKSLLDMEGNPKSCGIWAPCLSYCDGLFYLVYTDVKYWTNPYKDTPNYITTAANIEGPWSEPVYINSSGFDASLFHDDDGRKYFLNMEWDYRKADKYQFSGILLTELDPKGLTPVSEPVKIFKGSEKGCVEGPHIYKKDGYYYLFTAEGGTEYEHAETVARSKSVTGPYEIHPDTYISCAESFPESPIQKTGHGSLAQSADGRWWYACLCGRPLKGRRCPLGRETSVNEVVWKNGWPYLKNGTVLIDEYFDGYGEKTPGAESVYRFANGNDESFKLDFQSLRSKPRYEFTESGLRIYGGNSPACNLGQSILARRQEHFKFEAVTKVSLSGRSFQQMAGLVYRYDEDTYYFLRVAYNERLKQKALGIICMVGGSFSMPLGDDEIPVGDGPVYLKVRADHENAQFLFSTDGDYFKGIDYTIDVTTLSDECANPLGFTGAFIGMQCVDMCDKTAYADFEYFTYTVK